MSNKDFAILLDLDSVILNTGPHLLEWLQNSFNVGLDVKYEEFTEFRFEKNFPMFTRAMVEEVFSHPEFWLTIPSIPGATVFSETLCSLGEVLVCTDRFWLPNMEDITRESLCNATIQYDKLRFVDSKDKAKFAQEHNVKLAFEDRLDNAIAISEFCPVGLIGQPYNDNPWIGDRPIFRIAKDYIYPDLEMAGDWAIFMHDLHNSSPTGRMDDRFAIKAQPEPEKPKFETILDEAKHLVCGDRNKDYGTPFDNFSNTVAMVNGYLGDQLKYPLTPEDFAEIMTLVKISRAKNDINLNRPVKRDSVVDCSGYQATLDMVVQEKIKRGMYQ